MLTAWDWSWGLWFKLDLWVLMWSWQRSFLCRKQVLFLKLCAVNTRTEWLIQKLVVSIGVLFGGRIQLSCSAPQKRWTWLLLRRYFDVPLRTCKTRVLLCNVFLQIQRQLLWNLRSEILRKPVANFFELCHWSEQNKTTSHLSAHVLSLVFQTRRKKVIKQRSGSSIQYFDRVSIKCNLVVAGNSVAHKSVLWFKLICQNVHHFW